jgi:hypothetical protein
VFRHNLSRDYADWAFASTCDIIFPRVSSSHTRKGLSWGIQASSFRDLDGRRHGTPASEAKDTDANIAPEAAISRLLPIQDDDDQWEMHRSSVATVSGGAAPG